MDGDTCRLTNVSRKIMIFIKFNYEGVIMKVEEFNG